MAKFKLKFVLSGIDFGEDKFKLKFVACPSIAPRTITSAMGPVAQGPFSTSSPAPATILVLSPVVVLTRQLPHQPDLTKADPSISWSSCMHAASAAHSDWNRGFCSNSRPSSEAVHTATTSGASDRW